MNQETYVWDQIDVREYVKKSSAVAVRQFYLYRSVDAFNSLESAFAGESTAVK